MTDRYIGDKYASANPSWHAEDAAWKAEQIIKILSRNHCRPRHVIEVGCGAGGVLSSVLEPLGAEAQGIGFDISPYAISLAKKLEKQNLRFECTNFLNFPDYSGYDLLLCIDVFEHIEDYIGFLKKIQPRSEYFIFHVPLDMNIRGLLRKHHMKERRQVGHIHYFDSMTALAVLSDIGYKIVDHFYTLHLSKNLSMRSIALCRKLFTMVCGEDFAVQLLGGASMLVLTQRSEEIRPREP